MEPVLNTYTEYEICYGNRIHIKSEDGYNIKSSGFKVSGISDMVYFGDLPDKGLKTGKIFLFKLNSPTQPVVVKKSVGIIDYVKGEIKLNPMNFISTKLTRGVTGQEVPLIEISMCPYSNDVIGLQDLYLQLDINNSTVDMVADSITSGENTAGNLYTATSSYMVGDIARLTEEESVNTTLTSSDTYILGSPNTLPY